MRLVDADELLEHVWRDKLDSRELIAKMIENAPTEQYKVRHWMTQDEGAYYPLECPNCHKEPLLDSYGDYVESRFCPFCGWEMSD